MPVAPARGAVEGGIALRYRVGLAHTPHRPRIGVLLDALFKPSPTFLAAAIGLCAVSLAAPAQDWPAKPVRIVSPFAPGGGSDTVGRVLAEHLGEKLHQQFYIENRGGAGA